MCDEYDRSERCLYKNDNKNFISKVKNKTQKEPMKRKAEQINWYYRKFTSIVIATEYRVNFLCVKSRFMDKTRKIKIWNINRNEVIA